MRPLYRRPAAIALLMLSVAGYALAADINITMVTDRENAMYEMGEEASFVISAKSGETPVTTGEFSYTLTLDGGKCISTGKAQFSKEPTVVKGSLAEPGVLRCTLTYAGDSKPVVTYAAAAFSAEKIAPTAVEPDNFREFWQLSKRKLARVPMNAQLTKSMKFSNESMDVYKIKLDNILGTNVYGWLGVPTNAGPHPAILTVPAAGVYPTSASWVDWAQRGFIAMGISAHDYDVDLPKEKYDELRAGELNGYPYFGRTSRRSYYFMRVFMSLVRSIDYLTSRADWDGVNMVVTGSSQGGALSLVAAGLDDRVSLIAANVPALCDHTGKFEGRPSGWPQLIPSEDKDDLVKTTAGYYDAVNFARYIQCPSLVAVGLVDRTCPAMTVYSAFNVIDAPKEIMAFPLMGHAVDPSYSKYREDWIFGHVFGLAVKPGQLHVK